MEFSFLIRCHNNAQRWKYVILTGNFHLTRICSIFLQISQRWWHSKAKSLVFPTGRMISVDYTMNALEHSKVRLPFFWDTLYKFFDGLIYIGGLKYGRFGLVVSKYLLLIINTKINKKYITCAQRVTVKLLPCGIFWVHRYHGIVWWRWVYIRGGGLFGMVWTLVLWWAYR